MAEIIDDVIHLTQEIGPHPAGTEEEQQAALYLAGELQKESGFTPVIEDFQCVTNEQIPRLVCFGLALVAVVVSIVLPVAVIPCFFVVAIAAAVYALEILGKPVISRLLRTGASQNVVAKYQPSTIGGVTRRRKVILVANYDSGKVLKVEQSPIAGILPVLQKATAIALVLAAVLLFLRMTLFSTDTGAASSVLTMLLVICAVLFVFPIVRSILHIAAPFGHSANNNASGVAVLLDVAKQVGTGLVSTEEVLERGAREGGQVHGEAAARAAGAVSDGATIEYDVQMNPQESLAAAKAAIAALTGKPVADKVPVTDISSRLVKGGGLEPEDEEAVSGVHFEVSETPPAREKTSHFRTMVDDDSEDYDNVPSAQIGRDRLSRQEVEQQLESDAARPKGEGVQNAAFAEAAQTQDSDKPASATAAPSTESFQRPAPMSVVNDSHASPIDKTPAWARAAQAKARANKPGESQPHRVGRSRYADTVAAHLADSTTEHQPDPAARREIVQESVPASEDPILASRLAALHSEIESAEAPHISEETRSVLDNMAPSADSLAEGADRGAAEPHPSDVAAMTDSAASHPHETTHADAVASASSQGSTTEFAAIDALAIASDKDKSSPQAAPIDGVSRETPSSDAARTSQPAASAASGGPHTFASRLKSIASRKASDNKAEGMLDDHGASVKLHGDTDVKASPSPSATTAISPIDVSRFMNKETLDEALESGDAPFDADLVYDDDVFDAAVLSEEGVGQPMDAEETQRVSSERIQEAIQEASTYVPALESRSEDADMPQRVASPIMGMEDMLPQIPTDAPEQKPSAKRQVIVLPDVVAPHAGASGGAKQRAPMADTNEDAKAGSKTLLSNMLPHIDSDASSDASDGEPKDRFGLDLPALGETGQGNSAVSATGSFSTVGATGSFAPVGDELIADVDPEERYIEDADDSAYDEEYTETGAFAGPGYVEMPKSRAGRLFGRFRSKKKKAAQEETSVNEWVDVDDSYDARSVGKARGDWSSFRQDDEPSPDAAPVNNDGFVDIDYRETSFDNRRGWNGGAFSLTRLKKSVQTAPENEGQSADGIPIDEGHSDEGVLADAGSAARIDGTADTAEQINRELRKLQDFRHPDIDTEVWFVALGAEQYSHSGMHAFLDEHADELKGAVIINLEALGAGSLSSVEREGAFKTYKPSSRTKRFIRQAADRSGVTCRSAIITHRETSASIAMGRGVQALTIAGMAEGDTALYSAENDILENVDEDMLEDASKFVMALLKSI